MRYWIWLGKRHQARLNKVHRFGRARKWLSVALGWGEKMWCQFRKSDQGACLNGRGWSLLEILVVMALWGVLLSLGADAWKPLRQKYQLQAQAEDLLSALALARSEAAKRGVRVTLCVSSDGAYCRSDGAWTQGWLLFEDTDGNALRSASEPLIQAHAALPAGVMAWGNSPLARYVSYAPNRRSLLVSGAPQAGTITLCLVNSASTPGWELAINFVGNAHLTAVTLANCS